MVIKKTKNKYTKNNNKNKTTLVKKITITKLRELSEKTDGLVIKGYPGNANELMNYINFYWTDDDILLDGSKFTPEDCFLFVKDGIRNIYFEMSNKPINMHLLAIWRHTNRESFPNTWLSEYIVYNLDIKKWFP